MIFKKRPTVIVPLTGTTSQQLLDQAIEAEAAGADVVEWRIDFMLGLHENLSVMSISHEVLKPILALTSVPVLLTIRTAEQGGRVKLSPGRYRLLIAELSDAIMQLGQDEARIGIDFEMWYSDVPDLARRAVERGFTAVVSHHDWNETPDNLELQLRFEEMFEIDGAVPKLAVTAQSEEDVDRLLAVTKAVTEAAGRGVIALSMGEMGTRSRLEGWKYGSIATFAKVGDGSAPGQPNVEELREHLAAQQA